MLSQAERDTILKSYDNIFPIWGRKAIERGFDLPKPLGINVIGMYIDQGIEISNLSFSTGDNPRVPSTRSTSATIHPPSLRPASEPISGTFRS